MLLDAAVLLLAIVYALSKLCRGWRRFRGRVPCPQRNVLGTSHVGYVHIGVSDKREVMIWTDGRVVLTRHGVEGLRRELDELQGELYGEQ